MIRVMAQDGPSALEREHLEVVLDALDVQAEVGLIGAVEHILVPRPDSGCLFAGNRRWLRRGGEGWSSYPEIQGIGPELQEIQKFPAFMVEKNTGFGLRFLR